MKRIFMLAALVVALAGGLRAQDEATVTMLEFDGKIALFSIDASAAKSDEVVPTAIADLFHRLMETGVAGVNNGRKFMDNDNTKFRENFFKSKNPPYMMYVKGIQPEGDPMKTAVGDFKGTVLVKVNIDFLTRQLKTQNVMNK